MALVAWSSEKMNTMFGFEDDEVFFFWLNPRKVVVEKITSKTLFKYTVAI